ncbi:ABC transporter ATP-binding protein/permease [Brachybacterium sp. NBEC-018]|uniref:ABC transporter transmembrane domain-containing protein n=1 Tax=Brachybacterium sp. NBEC-018 TaxID=2996004 RepID=UPI00217540AB|nr:ABC transporter ATP-binding protein [Brachybacterium sp. NBEC-018]UVY84113.1 ABC transporter ATP-binding protein/permease [Brachybacterium sp. NBEC-018]
MTLLPASPPSLSVGGVLRLALTRDRRGRLLALSTAGLMLHQAAEAAVPILIGVVIDRAVLPRDASALALWLGVLAAVFVVLSLSYQRASRGMVAVYGHGEHDLRQLVAQRVLHHRAHTPRPTGEILSVTTSDTYRVAGVAWTIAQQASTVMALLTSSIALLVISVPLGLGVLLGAAAVLWGMRALARPLERLGMTEQASVASASEVATDAIAGLRVLHGLGAQQEMLRRYRTASAASRDGAVAAARSLLTYQAVSSAVSVLAMTLLTLAAGAMAVTGRITPGELVTVVGLAQFLQGSLAHIGTFGANWSHKRASARRLHGLVAEDFLLPAGTAEAGSPSPEAAPLQWRPEHGPAVHVPAGRMIGLHVEGAAQARAVTARLALRTAPARGELRVHGADALDLGPEGYRTRILAPPHDATVFTGTLRENVTLGDGPLDAQVVAATALDDVIAHLGSPDAPVGEGGRRLSGGQRQRLLLARALHDDAALVVLDEPTTALDPLTARRVAAGVRGLGRTLLLVTGEPPLLAACHEVVDLRPAAAGMGTAGRAPQPAEAVR